MGSTIAPARFNDVKEINAFESKGIKSYALTYSATIAWTPVSALEQHAYVTQLTGALTVNATVTNLLQGDRGTLIFEADSSQRVVTFGTNFISSGTLTVTAAKGATVDWFFDGTSIRIKSREIYA
jgi:hypothetical protein